MQENFDEKQKPLNLIERTILLNGTRDKLTQTELKNEKQIIANNKYVYIKPVETEIENEDLYNELMRDE